MHFKRIVTLCTAVALAAGGCGVSRQQAAQIGAQQAAQINQELPLVRNAALDRYIEQLGQQIVNQTPYAGQDFEFFIYRSDEVNAFALPGGFIYVSTGLIRAADNVSELAGVLGHEIAHVTRGHAEEQIERVQRANVGASLACIFTNICASQLGRAAIGVGGQAILASYSREAEREADLTAISYLREAGIDPRGLVTMFQELLRMREAGPGPVQAFFATHPLTEDRIEYVSERLEQLPSGALRGLTAQTQTYQQFRQAVVAGSA